MSNKNRFKDISTFLMSCDLKLNLNLKMLNILDVTCIYLNDLMNCKIRFFGNSVCPLWIMLDLKFSSCVYLYLRFITDKYIL